jgi:transcription initiation factor TFIIE subunit alpha
MRLTQKRIEEIVLPILGEEGLILIKYLYSKENVSEFDLSKRTKLDIKIVRKMLYLLYNHNLVGFNRKKDKEKGWYIYYWTLIPDNVRFAYYKRRKENLATLQYRLEQEHKELFFACPRSCVRINFDDAMAFEFHCSECGDLLNQDDNRESIAKIEAEIAEIKEELKEYVVKKKVKKVESLERKKVVKKKVKAKKAVKKKTITKKKTVLKKTTKTKSSVKKKVTKEKPVAKKKQEKKVVKKKKVSKKSPVKKKVVKKRKK